MAREGVKMEEQKLKLEELKGRISNILERL